MALRPFYKEVRMLYSVNYKSGRKEEADEIRCPVNKLGYIFKFIKDHPDKRYNISFKIDTEQEEKIVQQITLLRQVTQNYTIQCSSISTFRKLKGHGFNTYLAFPATDWETYQGMRESEVTDILIDGPLGFQVEKLAMSKGDIKIRALPNSSPNSALSADSASFFFIRPEDQRLYSSALDIIELNDSFQEREDALFDIYKREKFDYELNKVVTNLPYDVNNHFFNEEFVKHRLNCAQRCKIPNHSCHLCDNYLRVTKGTLKLMSVVKKE